jgi:uncharacterized protein with NRDE domain
LLGGTPRSAVWRSNRARDAVDLDAGVHGLSNALLDTPWPKVERTRARVALWAREGQHDVEPLFAALADRSLAPDDQLPDTGVTPEWERLLSAPFIVGERYGTRCSTVLTVDRDGEARFIERSFDATGATIGEVEHRFALLASRRATDAAAAGR